MESIFHWNTQERKSQTASDGRWEPEHSITRGFFTGFTADSTALGSGICEEFSALVLCLFGLWILAGEGCPGLAAPHPSHGFWQCKNLQGCPALPKGHIWAHQLGNVKNSLMGKEKSITGRLVMLPPTPTWKFKAWSWQGPEQPGGTGTAPHKQQVTAAGQGRFPPHGP